MGDIATQRLGQSGTDPRMRPPSLRARGGASQHRRSPPTPTALTTARKGLYVVMGVAGAGKTTVGEMLARTAGIDFVEGDEYHPLATVRKMAAGTPLTDDDRAGWLHALAARLAESRRSGTGLVITCSALKRAYRDILRASAPEVVFVFLHGSRALIAARLASRRGHFMPTSLLESQFATLEEPGPDERVWTYDIRQTPADIVSGVASRMAQSDS